MIVRDVIECGFEQDITSVAIFFDSPPTCNDKIVSFFSRELGIIVQDRHGGIRMSFGQLNERKIIFEPSIIIFRVNKEILVKIDGIHGDTGIIELIVPPNFGKFDSVVAIGGSQDDRGRNKGTCAR